jgi:hypothetical protein
MLRADDIRRHILIFATLIIIQTSDLGERRTDARPEPIIFQFTAMRQCPLFHKSRCVRRKISFDNFTGLKLASSPDCRRVMPASLRQALPAGSRGAC